MHLASSCYRNTRLCCFSIWCVLLRALLRRPCDLDALPLSEEEVCFGVVADPSCRPQSLSLGKVGG